MGNSLKIILSVEPYFVNLKFVVDSEFTFISSSISKLKANTLPRGPAKIECLKLVLPEAKRRRHALAAGAPDTNQPRTRGPWARAENASLFLKAMQHAK